MQISAPGSASPSSCPFEDENDDTGVEPVLLNLSDSFSLSFSLANDLTRCCLGAASRTH